MGDERKYESDGSVYLGNLTDVTRSDAKNISDDGSRLDYRERLGEEIEMNGVYQQ